MECERCGNELPEDARYCDACGSRVEAWRVGVDSEQAESIPVIEAEEHWSTVDPASGPLQPALGRVVVAGIAVIGVSAAVVIIALVGWVALPALFASV